jgi:hypothetical protein
MDELTPQELQIARMPPGSPTATLAATLPLAPYH